MSTALCHRPDATTADADLFAGLRAATAQADRCRSELVARYAPMTVALARRYRGRGESDEDLRQIAFLGLLEAIERFDPARDVEFVRFAHPTVLGLIRRHFRDGRRWVKLPRRLQELGAEIREAQEVLTARNARIPTVRELAAHLGVPESEVSEAMLGDQFFSPLSLDAPTSDDAELTLADRLGTDDVGLANVVGRTAILPLVKQLPERERDILISTFWHDEPQHSIGRRWGISQMQISRLLSRTLDQLRTSADVPTAGAG